MFKPSEWARRTGLSTRQVRYAITTGELDRLGLPPGSQIQQSESGRYRLMIPAPRPPASPAVALYARAWMAGGRRDLDAQVETLRAWAKREARPVLTTVREVAGPLELPEQLLNLVLDPTIPAIVVTHREAIGWLNAPLISAILESQARALVDLAWYGDTPRDTVALLAGFLEAAQRVAEDLRRQFLPRPGLSP